VIEIIGGRDRPWIERISSGDFSLALFVRINRISVDLIRKFILPLHKQITYD